MDDALLKIRKLMVSLKEIAEEGGISSDESRLLSTITRDLNYFRVKMKNALSDNIVSSKEVMELVKIRRSIIINARILAQYDGVISSDEKKILDTLIDSLISINIGQTYDFG
jgi:hypothetical protein